LSALPPGFEPEGQLPPGFEPDPGLPPGFEPEAGPAPLTDAQKKQLAALQALRASNPQEDVRTLLARAKAGEHGGAAVKAKPHASDADLEMAVRGTLPLDELESGARGALQGATLGYADELHGLGGALADKLTGKEGSFGDLYRATRDEHRRLDAAHKAAHPNYYGGGELMGALATAPVVPGGVLGSMVYGAGAGLGGSTADLTKGEYGRAALDTGIGAGAGALAHGVASGFGWLGKKAAGKAAELEAGLAESAANKAAAETAIARSEAGRSAQEVVRAIEKIEEFKDAAPEVYQHLVENGTLRDLQREYMQKAATDLGGKVAARDAAAQALRETAESEADRAAARLAESKSLSGATEGFRRAVGRYALRAGSGALLGGALGHGSGHGTEGALLGAAGLNLALAPTVLRNATTPAMRRLGYSLLGKVLGGTAAAGERPLASELVGATPEIETYLVPRLRAAFGIQPDQAKALADALQQYQGGSQ